MMQNLAIISELIRQQNKGTCDLYSKIPYKLRKNLDEAICSKQWDRVNERCEQQEQFSSEAADELYQFVLDKADEYIKVHKQNRHSDTSVEMTVDKFSIENEFKNDPARFVAEMAKCLKKEKELIFTYRESGSMNAEIADHIDDVIDQMDDMELKAIEELIQQADNHLYQAVKRIVDESRVLDIFDDLTSVDTDPGMACGDHFRNFSAEAKSLEMSGEKRKAEVSNCKQKALEALTQVYNLSLHYVEKLSKDLEAWKTAEKCWSVEVGPEPDTGSLINRHKRFGDVINTVLSWFSNTGNLQVIRQSEENHSPGQMDYFSVTVGNLEMEFKRIIIILQIIVVTQPKGVISIENKGKKDNPNYCTKKTQSFSTAIRVLASECFPSFYVKSAEVELVAEKDLAKKLTVAVTGRNNQPCLNVETTTGKGLPDIQFNIEVKNFSRVDVNNVYKQFFRLRYKVTVSVHDMDVKLETISLPFTFNTGANQILEHKGSRFWYLMSSKDLYNGDFHCPDPLPASDVIGMLDSRVACLGQKARRLTDAEKTFLRERLPVASDGTVTMQGFVKDKMRSLRMDEPLFPFYTWFYAVIHSIELLLLDAWQDGIIYGFCSDKNAEEMLMVQTVPEGTFLLRPSVSNINKTSSVDATAGLVMELKMRNEDAQPFDQENSEFVIKSLPLYYDYIEENTLHDAIDGIEFNNKPVAKFLYGRDGGRRLDVLKGYVKKPDLKYLPEYFLLIEKVKKLKFKKCSRPGSAAAEMSDREDESEQERNKRKRKYRKSSSNTPQSQVPSVVGDDSSRGSSSMQHFTEFPTEEIKQESVPNMQFQPSSAVQSSRSGTHGKRMPGTSEKKTRNKNTKQTDKNSPPMSEGMQDFGGLLVDFSQVSKQGVLDDNLFMNTQNDHTLSGSVQNGCEEAFMVAANSHRSPPQPYNVQHSASEINNNFGELSRSPLNNVGYTVSVTHSPASSVESSWQSPSSVGYNSYSPQNGRESNLQFNAQITANLPTTLNEACEPRRHTERRSKGNGRSNSRSSKIINSPIPVSPEEGLEAWGHNMDNMDHLAQVPLQFIDDDFQHHQEWPADNTQFNFIEMNVEDVQQVKKRNNNRATLPCKDEDVDYKEK